MANESIDWSELLQDYCERKLEDPKLTTTKFAKLTKRNPNTIRSRCNTKLFKAFKEQHDKIQAGDLNPVNALSAYEIYLKVNSLDYEPVPAPRTPEGNQNARKSGLWSNLIAPEELAQAIESMGGDVNYQDELLARAKLAGVLNQGKGINDYRKQVEQRIEENNGIATDEDVEQLASIRKSLSNNLRDFDLCMARIDQIRSSRIREEQVLADTRLKRLTGDKIDAEGGGSDELDVKGIINKAKQATKES